MGPLGVPELIFILILALLVFGPKRLPEIGRTLGRAMGEFRRATTDLKRTLNTEIAEAESRPAPRPVEPAPAIAPAPAPAAAADGDEPAEAAEAAESDEDSEPAPAPAEDDAPVPGTEPRRAP